MSNQKKPSRVMSTEDLASMAKRMRNEKGLTQRELADQLVAAGYADRLSVQAISQAEKSDAKADMSKLRVAIIEHLSGRQLEGPVWYFTDEAA